MSRFEERAKALRARDDIHVNCAQTVFSSFAPELGFEEEKAMQIGRYFGGGILHMGDACGAYTGALMALGLAGADEETAERFTARFRELQGGRIECRDLLSFNEENGGEKKPFCDALVLAGVGLLEEFLRELGAIE